MIHAVKSTAMQVSSGSLCCPAISLRSQRDGEILKTHFLELNYERAKRFFMSQNRGHYCTPMIH